ncbi:multidrug and toxin extrusion protein 1-like [Tubulanus polymorphus]|uniref:multidrug and toxin extrusion protein 1-like n=1 Tax=Tubulanus polymorphus TaxID=672921 RepID=UPI003DA3AB09
MYGLIPISIAFCGHLGVIDLGSVSLACMVLNVCGLGIAAGLTTGCETLFSQAYGNDKPVKLDSLLQRALLIILITCFPVWAIHLNISNILQLFGQDTEIASAAGQYVLMFAPGILANFIFQVLGKYLQNQNVLLPLVIISLFGNLFNIVCHYVALKLLHLGTSGSALSMVASHVIMLISVTCYMICNGKIRSSWTGWSRDCLIDWCEFLRFSLPSVITIFLEFFCLEIGLILAGTTSIAISALILAFREFIPEIYSDNQSVLELSRNLIPQLAVLQLLQANANVCNSILRGCGRQHVGTLVLFIGYYVIGLPIGIPCMLLTNLRTSGFLLGLNCGAFFNSLTLFTIVNRTDWTQQAHQAQMRLGNLHLESEETTPVFQYKIIAPSGGSSSACNDRNWSRIVAQKFSLVLISVLIFVVGVTLRTIYSDEDPTIIIYTLNSTHRF